MKSDCYITNVAFFPGHVLRNKYINCFEASVVLAYSILKREKSTTLYSYTENKEELLSLQDIPKSNYAAALKYCKERVVRKRKFFMLLLIFQ